MFDSLYIGATGMQAQQMNVDTIANNLANVNTTGFKKARISFSDLVSRGVSGESSAMANESYGIFSRGLSVGAGVSIANLAKIFDVGDLKKTDAPLDLSIQGEGFIEVVMPDGSSGFTRGGSLNVSKDGVLSLQNGYPLKSSVNIPGDAQSVVIHPDGRVQVKTSGQNTPMDIGKLDLVRFTSPQGLSAQGDNLYLSTTMSGEPIATRVGEEGVGTFAQGYLEGSNVKMVEEMVNLMVAQRSYEANVKVVQAADEILGMINGLRR